MQPVGGQEKVPGESGLRAREDWTHEEVGVYSREADNGTMVSWAGKEGAVRGKAGEMTRTLTLEALKARVRFMLKVLRC